MNSEKEIEPNESYSHVFIAIITASLLPLFDGFSVYIFNQS